MKKSLKVLSFLILALFGGYILVGCATSQPAQKDFESSDGRFSASFPAESPKEQTQTVKTQVGDVALHLFLVEKKDGAYMVGYSDYPESLVNQGDSEKILDGARDGAVTNVQGKLVGEKKISLSGHKGREIKIRTEKADVKANIYLAGSRLYQILVVTPKEKDLSASTDKFMDSFKILQ